MLTSPCPLLFVQSDSRQDSSQIAVSGFLYDKLISH